MALSGEYLRAQPLIRSITQTSTRWYAPFQYSTFEGNLDPQHTYEFNVKVNRVITGMNLDLMGLLDDMRWLLRCSDAGIGQVQGGKPR